MADFISFRSYVEDREVEEDGDLFTFAPSYTSYFTKDFTGAYHPEFLLLLQHCLQVDHHTPVLFPHRLCLLIDIARLAGERARAEHPVLRERVDGGAGSCQR
jgi:hypothetical protein